jgi:hypothetical protein
MVKIDDGGCPAKGAVGGRLAWSKLGWHTGAVASSTENTMTLSGAGGDAYLNGKVFIRNTDGTWACNANKSQAAYIVKLYDPSHFSLTRVVDCAFDDWGDWDQCVCARHQRGRQRWFARTPRFGGQNCVANNTVETGGCSCTTPGKATFHWCKALDWADWDACTKTCGDSGYKVRRRLYGVATSSECAAASAGTYSAGTNLTNLAETKALRTELSQLAREEDNQVDNRHMQELIVAFSTGMVSFMAVFAGIKLCGRALHTPRHDYDAISGDHHASAASRRPNSAPLLPTSTAGPEVAE